jgi:hypothetical protein
MIVYPVRNMLNDKAYVGITTRHQWSYIDVMWIRMASCYNVAS